ncbi:type I-U CRISPR-associated protein Cas5/Cas6 [Methylomonas sp. Kb3]|uniref:type I-G CRISPR-associated protein Csb2 n=1 Tax=Methylomonas sp. Kb3 TaxID=1611544 RepID=UPI000C33E35F|nr:type I-U CRISPR-associated protein Csb2 [Methylomonas sp. Kb3]PKD41021.1 type I-U CRISPR-associated protein Cas5/Cas6 [Methylomonas sp. Kb3]
MNDQALLISVRLLDDRYHGNGTWPPSPFRLFQALVAAAFTGRTVSDAEAAALRWLEQLPPPVVLSPTYQQSALTTYYVPRNGADAQQGNLAAAAKKRDAKLAKPWLFESQQPLHYVWFFPEPAEEAQTLAELSERLYQLGRGVDMAFAWAEQLTADQAKQIIVQHAGPVFRPTPQGVSDTLDCPIPGQSFDSLLTRYQGQLKRLRNGEFHKPPLPIFQPTGYNCPSSLLLFDIQNEKGALTAQALTDAGRLTQRLIELAKNRLKPHFPEYSERHLAGIGANDADKALRIRVIPLPSIGHEHTQPDIRRVLVEVPADCPLQLADVEWAFAGLPLEVDLETGEILTSLVKSIDRKMLDYYGIGKQKAAHVWRTVTPVVLPLEQSLTAQSGAERVLKQSQLHHAARQALRHCGITAPAQILRIQREPFDSTGTLAEDFAFQRFDRSRLYHLELVFPEQVAGPLVIGNGRYVGLGLLRPAAESHRSVISFGINPSNRPTLQSRSDMLQAVRRALMSLDRQLFGQASRLISGHEKDGSTARSGNHRHIFLAAHDNDGDGLLDRLLVVAPWEADRNAKPASTERERFERVVSRLTTVRAGALGVFDLQMQGDRPNQNDPLMGSVRRWKSISAYRPTRCPKTLAQADETIRADAVNECLRRGLPEPKVEILSMRQGPKGGIKARLCLSFAVAVNGPLLLGKDSHEGGGLFGAD